MRCMIFAKCALCALPSSLYGLALTWDRSHRRFASFITLRKLRRRFEAIPSATNAEVAAANDRCYLCHGELNAGISDEDAVGEDGHQDEALEI